MILIKFKILRGKIQLFWRFMRMESEELKVMEFLISAAEKNCK